MKISLEQWKTLHGRKGRPPAKPKKQRPPFLLVPPRSEAVTGGIVFELPTRIESLQNLREHWRTQAARTRVQRGGTTQWLRVLTIGLTEAVVRLDPPLVVTLVRLAPRKLDHSNMVGGFKHCQDGVADWLQIDDGSSLLEWRYEQEKNERFGVRVRIERLLSHA